MTASTWLVIAIILFTLAGALFAAAVIMFFVMNIPSIIGDLSGRTLAKGIQNIRSENAYANSKNARAANRRNNPDRQFSIGNEYSKEKGYNTSLAHVSRRLDINTLRGNKSETSSGGTGEKMSVPPSANNSYNEYTQAAAVLDTSNNQYTNATTVLDTSNNQYTNATTVLDNANNQYTNATTVLNNANNQYTNATTVLDNANNQYTNATTVLNNANNQYTNATTVLNNANNQYTNATTVLNNSNNQYTNAKAVFNNRNTRYSNNMYTKMNTYYDDQYTQSTTILGGENTNNDLIIDSYYNEYTQGTTVLSNGQNANAQANGDFISAQTNKPQSNLPLGFRVVRRVSVTHCNEVI